MQLVDLETVDLRWESPEIAVLTLNRPNAGNTINSQLAAEFRRAAEAARFSGSTKVLIVTGNGRFFCAGADLKERDKPASWIWRAREAINQLQEMEQIVIAAIHGPCMGGGTEIALACDLRLAGRSASIGLPEVKFGALPAAGGPQRLARLVGPSRAKYLVCSGRALSAEEAASLGVVDEVVEDDALWSRALEVATELAAHAGYALRTAKSVIDQGLDIPLAAALRAEYEAIDHMASPDEFAAEVAKAMERTEAYAKIFGSAKPNS